MIYLLTNASTKTEADSDFVGINDCRIRPIRRHLLYSSKEETLSSTTAIAMSMSVDSPPVEQQRFARTQTPESPRPVHVPEPTKIPVLLNQMDPSSNDLATYNIPSDQNFAHYGDSLENPAYKQTSIKEENDPFQAFLRNADNVVANDIQAHIDPNPNPNSNNAIVPENSTSNSNPAINATMQYTNHFAGSSLSNALLSATSHFLPAVPQQPQSQPPSRSNTDVIPTMKETGATTRQSEAQQVQETNGSATQAIDGNQEQSIAQEQAIQQSGEDTTQSKATEKDPVVTATTIAETSLGVDYQSLLDTISQSASTAPPPTATATTDVATASTNIDAVMSESHPTTSLPSFPGLPPKPPPLETKTAPSASASSNPTQVQQSAHHAVPEALYLQQTPANGYHYQANTQLDSVNSQPMLSNPYEASAMSDIAMPLQQQQNQPGVQSSLASPLDKSAPEPADRPWSPKTQAIYDAFLEDERRYVTEGIWDRFPSGSRLFVGNLPSEKVTKRDLFHRFHRHGKLAQISIKQAYGFIQFHDSQSCKAALDAEQGVELRGRKVHLEISKPQKNTKNASQPNQPPPANKNQPSRKRSRSPPRRNYSDFRDEPSRRREDYRSRRSPSPRGYRRDDRARSRDDRRSPIHSSSYGTPQPMAYDDEASLPYPRRDPRYVPDAQVIVLDGGVDQAFLNWVEDGLKRKGLSVGSTWLNQRTPLPAVIKRQIMEGVQAIVKISSVNQMRSKIPVQVFDRGAGTSNVTFNEYADLDVPVAADIILQARQKERANTYAPRPPFPPNLVPPSPYQQPPPHTPWTPQSAVVPQYPPHPPPPQNYTFPPHLQHPAQQQYRPQPQPQPSYTAPNSASSQASNLHELLANLKGGTAPPTPQSVQSVGQPFMQYGQPPPPPPPPQHQQQQYYSQPQYPQMTSLPPQHQHQNGAPPQQNVQNIMDQLARFQR